MSLCNLCNNLTFANLYPPNYYCHGENLAAVELSAKNCQLCKVIHRSIKNYIALVPHEQRLYFEGAVDAEYDGTEGWEPWEPHRPYKWYEAGLKLQLTTEKRWPGDDPVDGFEYIGVWMKSTYLVARLPLAVEEGDLLGYKPLTTTDRHYCVAGRVLTSQIPAKAQFELARHWLDDCRINHRICRDHSSEPHNLPNRVIDVTADNQPPKLINGTGKRALYATLSHCWGNVHTMKTERANIQRHRKGIPLEELPKTFREAVITCRMLHIPYLWIDSLCIVQDDTDDWEYHSSMMDTIFNNCTLSLAATVALDSSHGLFLPVEPNIELPWLGPITLPPSFGNCRGQAYICPERNHSSFILGETNLQRRGWVFQEKCLSLRTLHFFAGQWLWTCSEITYEQNVNTVNLKYRKYNSRTELATYQQAFNCAYEFELEQQRLYIKGKFYRLGVQLKALMQKHAGHLIKGFNVLDVDTDEFEDAAYMKQNSIARERKYDQSSKEGGNEQIYGSNASPHPRRGLSIVVDLRNGQYLDDKPPTRIDLNTDRDLYEFLFKSTFQTVHHFWYSSVEKYGPCNLTFASDRLPALAGLASRVHSITKDQYLAGHWRRELERSLFWTTINNNRVRNYRAPSWSWASVGTALIHFNIDRLNVDHIATPVQILETQVHVSGKNPFGCVTDGRIVIKAPVIRASWQEDQCAWLLEGNSDLRPVFVMNEQSLRIITAHRECGTWDYDDLANGIFPGPPITTDTPIEEVAHRRISRNSNQEDNENAWQFGTYLPESLVLVKGGTDFDRVNHCEVLVLARTDGPEGEYRRVGVGELSDWGTDAEHVEVLTVI